MNKYLTNHENKLDIKTKLSNFSYPHIALYIENEKAEVIYIDTNDHPYVDLGLPSRTLWATYNVGATGEGQYGDLFAWGETEPKTDKSYWSNYKYCNGSYNSLTKYSVNVDIKTRTIHFEISTNYGIVDYKTALELSDDAAHVNMGGDWRMPTLSECEELRENTVYSWGSRGGINGMILSSKNNSNSLFFPAAGSRDDSGLDGQGTGAYVWSSSINMNTSYLARSLHGSQDNSVLGSYDRYYGQSVRGVISI